MLDAAMRMAPKDSRILVVGVCMQPDQVHPLVGIGRELNIQFALGYQPDEFAQSLRSIADGAVDLRPLITGTVAIDGVPQAFEDLGHPDVHAKILVQP
jgi:threonine dehydrogenase-like Zn-dependent dehydrogenase